GERDVGITGIQGHVGIDGSVVLEIAARAKFGNEEVSGDRSRGSAGIAANADEGPVVANGARAVAGVFVGGLIVREGPAIERPAPVPHVRRGVKNRMRGRLGAVVTAAGTVRPVADVEVIASSFFSDMEEKGVNAVANGRGVG